MIDQTGLYHARWLLHKFIVLMQLSTLTMGFTVGCSKVHQPRVSPPGPTYTGPAFLHGTIGSIARVRGYEPLLVSGYGLVVNLDQTGSAEVPAFLRQWLINEMRKRGVGSASLPGATISPAQMLASHQTAVVVVQGLIPPGATKGTRFDVLVSSLPQTQTTSLEGGRLWTVDLSIDGSNPSMRFGHKLAQASGPMYINPLESEIHPKTQLKLQRQGVILSGGVATTHRETELVLNQPSWQRSRLVADRINERFPKAPQEARDTAIPIDDSYIKLNIPRRYHQHPDDLLELINHLFVQRGAGFEEAKSQQLADLLVAEPRYAPQIVRTWIAMGKTVLPTVRRYFHHPNIQISLAALEAGARLEDEAVIDPMMQLIPKVTPKRREQIAQFLMYLPRSLRGASILHSLLDDDDLAVRLAAYESLAAINDPMIHRRAIDGPDPDRFKFVLDVVPTKKPLVYIAQRRIPRLVVFSPTLGFRSPFLAKLWENRLMLRHTDSTNSITVFYQRPGQSEGFTYQIGKTVPELVYLLAHKPTVLSPDNGFNFSYGQVVNVLYQLCHSGNIPSDVHLQINPIAAAIAQAQVDDQYQPRPETGAVDQIEPLEP